MSYTPSITNELIRDKSLKANTKILLLVLMTYENKEGFAYPSQPRLIEETGLSKNTLLKCLNELEEKGYVKRVKEKGENNKYYINSWKIYEIWLKNTLKTFNKKQTKFK